MRRAGDCRTDERGDGRLTMVDIKGRDSSGLKECQGVLRSRCPADSAGERFMLARYARSAEVVVTRPSTEASNGTNETQGCSFIPPSI